MPKAYKEGLKRGEDWKLPRYKKGKGRKRMSEKASDRKEEPEVILGAVRKGELKLLIKWKRREKAELEHTKKPQREFPLIVKPNGDQERSGKEEVDQEKVESPRTK